MDDGKVRRTNRWLTIAVIVLAAGVVALGVALIAQSGNEAAPAPAKPTVGLADAATVQMFDALNEAASTDGERYASFFAENGVLDESVGVTKGREAIARHIQRYIDGGFWVERDGPVIQNGLFAAHAISAATGSGMAMYQLTPDGKIQHLWAFVH